MSGWPVNSKGETRPARWYADKITSRPVGEHGELLERVPELIRELVRTHVRLYLGK